MQLLVEEAQNTENTAAQTRVTPQELAQATAAIEARQNALAQHEAATIPIGEAVHQLNLEATPEEVLAEVQAQRNAKTQTNLTAAKQNTRSKSVKIMAAVIVIQLGLLAFMNARFVTTNRMNVRLRYDASEAHARIQELEINASNLYRSNQTSAQPEPKETLSALRQMNPGLFHSLDIGDGQLVACKFDTLETLAQGAKPADVQTALHPTGTTWNLLRRGDKFFVQGWTTPQYAELLMNGHTGLVYATKNIDRESVPHVPITLPVELFANTTTSYTTDAPAGVWVKPTP